MSRKSLNRSIILKEAVQLADSESLEYVTLSAIAQRLKVKTPSLYNHIDGMDDLRKAMALLGLQRLREVLLEASVGKAGEDAILSIGKAYVSFVRKHPGLYEATMPTFHVMDEEIQEAGDKIVQLMLLVLESYKVEKEEALHTVRGLRSIVHGFSSLEWKKGFGLDLNNDESLEKLLKTYLAGLQLKQKKTSE